MTGLRRALLALGALGVVLTGGAVALVLSSDHLDDRPVHAAVGAFIAASYIGVGLFAWWRRPDNRFGALMAAVGFATFLGALAAGGSALLFTLGTVLGGVYIAVAVHMVLAFPSGRLETPLARRAVPTGYALSVLWPLTIALFDRECDCEGVRHPDNLLLVADEPGVAAALEVVASLAAVVLIVLAVREVVRRYRATGRAGRRVYSPVLLTAGAMLVMLVLMFGVSGAGEPEPYATLSEILALVVFGALPYAFLLGLARSRWWRAGAVTDALQALGRRRGGLREALAEALGDPGLQLAYWLPDQGRYVDADGLPVAVPERATEVERDGRRVAALLHDPTLCDEPELLRAVSAAAALALDNERLDAELRARVEELRDSRQRLLEAGLAERRRLERDLHDGAQQRLVSLSLQLGLVAARLDRGADGVEPARALLDGARDEARAALEDLRELARGIHPAVLTDRGLPAALEALADRSPVPVEVRDVPEERLPPAVEAAAYFVVAESLTNVAKYASATHAEVGVARVNGHAVVEVRDDGVGGADPGAGSGLRGLADRLAALDGRLQVLSPPGGGTVVRAEVPCASS